MISPVEKARLAMFLKEHNATSDLWGSALVGCKVWELCNINKVTVAGFFQATGPEQAVLGKLLDLGKGVEYVGGPTSTEDACDPDVLKIVWDCAASIGLHTRQTFQHLFWVFHGVDESFEKVADACAHWYHHSDEH